MKNSVVSEIKRSLKLSTKGIAVLIIAAVVAFVYVRTHPRWKEAELTIESADRFYDIHDLDPDGTTLETRILPPEGYERVPVSEGSFGEYMRKYPLLPDDIKLPAYNGTAMDYSDCAAVFDISLEKDGYQQCADTVIRLYSDYFYETGQLDRISFMFSNGDKCSYNNWRKGKRMFALADFSCEIPAALPSDSHQQYMNYLKEVMRYAGALSLQKESERITPEELQIGDIICNNAHVVLIADEAVNEKGEKCYLIGQSFIPAVCFHIISRSEGNDVYSWYTQEQLEQDSFAIGTFRFNKENILRWKEGF